MASAAALQPIEFPASEAEPSFAPHRTWTTKLKLSDFPIPPQVAADQSWTEQMHEIAEHVGSRATLLFCETFGGKSVYVPRGTGRPRDRFSAIIGEPAARALIAAFGGSHLAVPRAGPAIARARRAAVLAHARAGTFNISATAEILGVTRNYAGWLVNHSGEAIGVVPAPLPLPREQQLLSEVAAAVTRRLGAAGIRSDLIRDVALGIVSIGEEARPTA